MPEHEEKCEHVREECTRCNESVARKDRDVHDCVSSMLKRYHKKSSELTELSKKVDDIT